MNATEVSAVETKTVVKPETELLFDGASGCTVPQRFAEEIRRECVTGVDDETYAILADPDHAGYWEAWTDVLDNAVLTDGHGNQYRLYQDGDVWMVPAGMEWDDNEGFFVWPDVSDPGGIRHFRRQQPA